MAESESQKEMKLSLPEFLDKGFECLFNQNGNLHSGLASMLKERFDKLDERLDLLEENLKQGFLFYTREIMKGLDAANQVIIDKIES